MVSHATGLVEHPEQVGQENVIAGTESGLDARIHPQIAWAKRHALRDGAAIASKKVMELNSKLRVRDNRNKKQKILEVKVW